MEKIIKELTDHQKDILRLAGEPESIILFNIKGMIQVLHQELPFDFVEMGYEDIQFLKEKGLIAAKDSMQKSHVLQGEEYLLTPLGHTIAKILNQ